MLIYIIIFFLLLYIWGFFIEPELLTVKKYKIEDLGKDKIVFVSDFHIGKLDKFRLHRIIKKINSLNPDMVLSGGDFIKGHSKKSSMSIEKIAEELKKINAPTITVLGNHDMSYGKEEIKTALKNAGITVLDNSGLKVSDIYFAGVGNKKVLAEELDSALKNAKDKVILISHTPDIYYDVKKKVNLILAGHVHGGQVRLPFAGALICPSKYGTRFASGDFNETGNRMIVTRGLGTSILNVRFLDMPEIVLLENSSSNMPD